MEEFLRPTDTIESDHPHVQARTRRLTQGCNTDVEKAVKLFAFVRDDIRYNIYMISMFPEEFKASFILEAGKGYCVQKAVLLAALSRAAGIPNRIAFARIRNHRVPEKLYAKTRTRVFPAHGFNQFFLQGRWVSAAATFDRNLCEKIEVPVVEFDGTRDALLPDQTQDGRPYIEYLQHYDPVADLPLEWIVERTSKIWGIDKRTWITRKDRP
jgi:transglutaminase-like putative cysteine protease